MPKGKKKDPTIEAAVARVEESSSYLRDAAPFAIELAECRFTETVTVVGRGTDKFRLKEMQRDGIRMFYCGEYIVFECEGHAAHAVSFSRVLGMQALRDFELVDGVVKAKAEANAKAAADARHAEQMAKKLKFEAQAPIPGKRGRGRPKKDQVGETATLSDDVEHNTPPPAAPPISIKDVEKDLAGMGEGMSPEEKRSLMAASRRNAARRG